ncbi:hypothetical protein [Streptomyces sp. CNQ085]|uniref:hypothetical protein n=1 Tax=Streptomyces sp. CNQ085 TaxID=2886944 RepID=UPI0035AF5C35
MTDPTTPAGRREQVLRAAIGQGLLDPERAVLAAFVDLDGIAATAATRTVLAPDAWPLRITAHNPHGGAKSGPPVRQDVAGPACFAGDLLARDRELPLLAPGDLVVLPDTGAYYFSTPFHYNSLPEPAVHGFRTGAGGRVGFETIRPAQSPPEALVPAGRTA